MLKSAGMLGGLGVGDGLFGRQHVDAMAAHFAAPIFRILSDARQQLAGPCRLDHGDGAVADRLCQLRIERHQEVQALAGVGVDDSEQRRIGRDPDRPDRSRPAPA